MRTYLKRILIIIGCLCIMTPMSFGKTNQEIKSKGAYISEQSFGTDYHMNTLFSQISTSFQVEAWQVTDAELNLVFSTTQLVDHNLSTLTVSINDVRFYSQNVDLTDGSKRELRLAIPTEYLIKGTNTIKLEGYIRTQDGLPCVDDVSPANWLNIFEDSSVSLKYTPEDKVETISDFYNTFGTLTAIDYDQSCVAFRKNASNAELTVASEALAYLSKTAKKNYERLDFMAVENEAELAKKQYILYVSTYEHILPSYKALLSDTQKQEMSTGAVLTLVETPQGQNVLLLVGNEIESLRKGAKLLGNPELMAQFMYKEKVITEDIEASTLENSVNAYYTLSETGKTVKGAFRQNMDFYIDVATSKKLAEGSEVYLDLRYSENLDFDRSLVTVYINDTPIGSKKLSFDKANGDTLSLVIPTDIDVSGSFNLRVAFDLEIKDLWCTLRVNEMPWAYISPKSELKLNMIDVPFVLFEYYPAPFVKDRSFNEVTVLMPDQRAMADYKALGDIVKTFGRFLEGNQGDFEIRSASDAGDLTGKNVISIGTYEENAFTASLNKDLFFKFSEDGKAILSNEKMQIDAEYGKNLGTVQLLKAGAKDVWRTVLVASGTNAEGMLDAVNYLGSEKGLWSLYGDGYIAVGEDLAIYRFKEDNTKELSFTTTVREKPDFILFAVFAGMILILMMVALVLLFVKYRKRRDADEE